MQDIRQITKPGKVFPLGKATFPGKLCRCTHDELKKKIPPATLSHETMT